MSHPDLAKGFFEVASIENFKEEYLNIKYA